MKVRLDQQQLALVRSALFDRAGAPTTRLHHRTGENVSEPLFAEWIKVANLFRDATEVELVLKEKEVAAGVGS